MSLPVASFSEMRAVAERFFDAQFNDGRSIEKLDQVCAIGMVFQTNLPNQAAVESLNRGEALQKIDQMFMQNVENVEKRSEKYRESFKGTSNKLICKVRNIQQRKGLGLGEENTAGNFRIFARVVIHVKNEDGEWKIGSVQQTKYTKTRL